MRSALDIPISVTRPIPQPVDKSTIELVLQVFLQQLVFHFFVSHSNSENIFALFRKSLRPKTFRKRKSERPNRRRQGFIFCPGLHVRAILTGTKVTCVQTNHHTGTLQSGEPPVGALGKVLGSMHLSSNGPLREHPRGAEVYRPSLDMSGRARSGFLLAMPLQSTSFLFYFLGVCILSNDEKGPWLFRFFLGV